jgi:hypothetical protein
MGGEPSSFHPLTRKKRISCSGVPKKLPRDATNRMTLAKIDWESLLRAAKPDKDLRCSAQAALQPTGSIKPTGSIFLLAFRSVSRDSLPHFRWLADP